MHVVKYRFNGSVIAEIWAKTTAAMLLHEIGVKNLAEKLDEIRGDGVLSLTKLDSKNVFFFATRKELVHQLGLQDAIQFTRRAILIHEALDERVHTFDFESFQVEELFKKAVIK